MKIKVNLATRFYVNVQKVNFFIFLAAIILLIWLSAGTYSFTANLAELNKFSLYKTSTANKSQKDQVSESDYNKMLAEVKIVNSILSRRSVNWLDLFSQLEILVPEGVALRGLEPTSKGEILKISASARSFEYIRKFMENLEGSSNFTEVYLTDHAIIKVGNSQKGINFSVSCKANI